MTTTILTEALAAIKNVKASEIKNIDTFAGTFELVKSVYSYELTKSGKMIKSGSVKFFATISDVKNCLA